VDLYTEQGSPRLISNEVIIGPDFSMPIVGFENHGGRTFIGENRPLGQVKFGFGNNGQDGQEGVLYRNVVGTYLHGPLLPKNPALCDFLLATALARKYGACELEPLNDAAELAAHDEMCQRVK
jgi:CobQ-like glutamine amidotransferase family enzyme